ncbi:MAG: translation initiation factor IF-2 [Planctomycetes bacterium]|nr:translation initiation factor IF-2 [Planctomycetota bacterium]
MAKRVFQVAKELGVKSTAIVTKCQAEGLDIKNHMSTLSAGLEATILEWFSEGDHATTVETSARVDLDKVKSKTTRKRKKKVKVEEIVAEVAVEGTATAVVETPLGEVIEAPETTEAAPVKESEKVASEALPEEVAEAAAKESPVKLEAQPIDIGQTKVTLKKVRKPRRKSPQEVAAAEHQGPAEEPGETSVEKPAVAATASPEKVEEPVKGSPVEVSASEPDKPEDLPVEKKSPEVKPVEPIEAPKPHVPTPAVLQGPKVIRVERPDTSPPPHRREPRRRTIADVRGKEEATPADVPPVDGASPRRGRRRTSITDEKKEGGDTQKRSKSRTRKRRGGRGYEISDTPATPHQWGDRDLQERQERLDQASGRSLLGRARRLAHDDEAPGAGELLHHRRIEKASVKEPVTVKDLSTAMGVRANEIMGKLMQLGVMATVNQSLDADAAMAVALEFGVELTVAEEVSLLDQLKQEVEKELSESEMQLRPPIVAFLGHVDHGKTSLLDRIRQTDVTAGEAGGITQHIGSYLYDDGKRRVAFLDTPGHKAFTAMRARGANMTDIVVLVVAADDGVMPQTVEAINHAQAAEVPLLVALNKTDLPGLDINRVLGQLAEHQLISSEWGGETEIVHTSATTGSGIADLIEHLDYLSELRQLKARYTGPAVGWVVESEMTTGQGATARLLVNHGVLKPGDVIVSGSSYGRVRSMLDAMKRNLKEAGPATPVEVTGLDRVPRAGEEFFVVESISRAAQIADEQQSRIREKSLAQRRQVTLENLFSEIEAGQVKELNVIIKADVQGSVDVLRKTMTEMNTSEVAVRVLHAAVGGISESDVLLAEASGAIVIGFQVVAEEHAKSLADTEGVEIRLYRVIYDITDDIKKALEGMLAPRIEERQTGRLEVRQIFKISRMGTIAGCYVTEGTITRQSKVRLIRESIIVRDDVSLDSLKRHKDDASEVRAGMECGVKLVRYDDVKVGDVIEVYEQVAISRSLEMEQEQTV